MKPIPKVKPGDIADAVVDSVRNRAAEIAVPRYVGALAATVPLVPVPLMDRFRKVVRGDRALHPDTAARAAYAARLDAADRSEQVMTTHIHDAVIVGAGFGGMGAAIQLKRLGYDDLAILEREDDLGGTWHVNRYPGLAVDIPSSTYSYSFEPNPHWTRLFAPGPELKAYAVHVADKYDLRRHMRFDTVVERRAVGRGDVDLARVARGRRDRRSAASC